MKSNWWVDTTLASAFPSLEEVFALEGEEITRSSLSILIKIKMHDKYYYIKRYNAAGKHLRKYMGRSRIRAEWENLLLFKSLGLPVPHIVAYGEEKKFFLFKRGALILEELVDYQDLSAFAEQRPQQFKRFDWMRLLVQQISAYTLKLHQEQFIHNDLKWRNLLINNVGDPSVYFIDCPVGRRRFGWLVKRGIIKDLACLDKKAKIHLSRTTRLRFYCLYRQIKTLDLHHKKEIKKIVLFHKGRE